LVSTWARAAAVAASAMLYDPPRSGSIEKVGVADGGVVGNWRAVVLVCRCCCGRRPPPPKPPPPNPPAAGPAGALGVGGQWPAEAEATRAGKVLCQFKYKFIIIASLCGHSSCVCSRMRLEAVKPPPELRPALAPPSSNSCSQYLGVLRDALV